MEPWRVLRTLPMIIVVFGSVGCGESGSLNPFGGMSLLKKANETSALAQLRKYSIAQNLMMAEQGRYAQSLSTLYDEGYMPGRDRRLLAAWEGAGAPKPLSGYVFADIVEHESGGELDGRFRSGLSAHPVVPGESGDRVLLILLDEESAPMPAEVDGGFIGGANWRLFWAKHEDVNIPLTQWPSDLELQSTFHEIRKRTPQEGVREAERLAGDAEAGRTPKDPVFAGE